VVWSLNLLLNAFIFIPTMIILLLVCLIIIDLLYVNASVMLSEEEGLMVRTGEMAHT
jgi:hypothetical protein